MGDKANCKAWGVKTLFLVFALAVGVRIASDYSGVWRRQANSGITIINFLRRKTWQL